LEKANVDRPQVQIDGDPTSPEALRTTTIGSYEVEYVQDVARSTVNTFAGAGYVSKEVRHYFAGGVLLEKAESTTPVSRVTLDYQPLTAEWTFHLGDNQGSTEVAEELRCVGRAAGCRELRPHRQQQPQDRQQSETRLHRARDVG
jgi:hypothetical protein